MSDTGFKAGDPVVARHYPYEDEAGEVVAIDDDGWVFVRFGDTIGNEAWFEASELRAGDT